MVGFGPPPMFQTSHSRSMLAWCSQKIGSSAAVFGSVIRPPPPPTWTCTGPCGCASSSPNAGPWCAKPVRGPPNPVLAPTADAVNAASASAAEVLVTTPGSGAPPFTDGRRCATNSGFAEPSGMVGTRNARGSALPGAPLL